MLRNVYLTSFRRLPRFHARATRADSGPSRTLRPRCTAAVASTAVFLWYLSSSLVHNDAEHILHSKVSPTPPKRTNSTGVGDDGALHAVVWGSNKSHLIDPQAPEVETFQDPVNVKWSENTALRDMALHEKHAACVDARGDVFQWGEGFFSSKSDTETPKATLRDKNIVKIQITDSRVYALSASGRIYVFAANEEKQKLSASQTSSMTPWRAFSWMGPEQQTIDFVEIFPKEKLDWGETFTSIVAGSNHLLALTSRGRTYAHAMSKDANSHGQLGLGKVPVPSSSLKVVDRSPFPIELPPQSSVDPHAKTSTTRDSLAVASEHPNATYAHHIRFSDALFEIPSLRGVKVSQIAAGSRSSFVNTNSGRVLGWGANEHGQIGLGSCVNLNTVTIPTEIDLNKNIPSSTKSRCLSIVSGGDLTCFVTERNARESHTYVDILCCGNGQWGGLGNKTYSSFQGDPVTVKNVSGLREFNEEEQKLSPIVPHAISVSPTGHILLTLDTQLRAGPGGSGRDLVAWGCNHDYQLGTGKRTSLSAPTTLERPEGGRFLLAKCKATVRDLRGNVWKKNVEVEQFAIAGYGNSVVYWKIKA